MHSSPFALIGVNCEGCFFSIECATGLTMGRKRVDSNTAKGKERKIKVCVLA